MGDEPDHVLLERDRVDRGRPRSLDEANDVRPLAGCPPGGLREELVPDEGEGVRRVRAKPYAARFESSVTQSCSGSGVFVARGSSRR
jgi:hypothetical protein